MEKMIMGVEAEVVEVKVQILETMMIMREEVEMVVQIEQQEVDSTIMLKMNIDM